MKLATKVIIFISTISLVFFILVYLVLKDNYRNLIKFEDELVNKNIKNLIDNIYISSESIENILNIYSTSPDILEILKDDNTKKFEELFIRNNFTHLFLLDKNKDIVKAGVYNRNSEEFYYINNRDNSFKNIDKLKNEEKIYFTTYNYEKILFNKIKIKNKKLGFNYILIGKAFDSNFLSFITRLSDSYLSLVFSYDFKNTNSLRIAQNEYFYDIKRDDSDTLFTYLKLNDHLKNEDFYLSMNINRLYFLKVMNNNENILYLFVLSIFSVLILSYIFITKLFTKRIDLIIEKIKEVSKNKRLQTKITMNYNDDITYLSNRINEMFISLNNSQHQKIKKERDFLQTVLDLQKSIILISDGSNIKSTNKRFDEHFNSKESFLSNLAILDDNVKKNFLEIIKDYNSFDKPAKIKINDNKAGYYIFDIKKIDLKNYIVYMNDVSKLNKHINKLKEKASYDDLTKIYNKNSIVSIGKEWSKYKNFSIVVLDIDFFKKINDTYGHLYGDYILRDSVAIIKNNLRDSDLIGRFGGEEFIILIENTNIDAISLICENLRLKLEKHLFEYDKFKINITFSFGFSIIEKNKTFDESFELADKALYNAKNTGRNKVCYLF